MGSSSAVGGASMKDWRRGMSSEVEAQKTNALRSVFEMPPIGLMSALLHYKILESVSLRPVYRDIPSFVRLSGPRIQDTAREKKGFRGIFTSYFVK
jgi:hypothetical protein